MLPWRILRLISGCDTHYAGKFTVQEWLQLPFICTGVVVWRILSRWLNSNIRDHGPSRVWHCMLASVGLCITSADRGSLIFVTVRPFGMADTSPAESGESVLPNHRTGKLRHVYLDSTTCGEGSNGFGEVHIACSWGSEQVACSSPDAKNGSGAFLHFKYLNSNDKSPVTVTVTQLKPWGWSKTCAEYYPVIVPASRRQTDKFTQCLKGNHFFNGSSRSSRHRFQKEATWGRWRSSCQVPILLPVHDFRLLGMNYFSTL